MALRQDFSRMAPSNTGAGLQSALDNIGNIMAANQVAADKRNVRDLERARTKVLDDRATDIYNKGVAEEAITKNIFAGAAKGPQARDNWLTNAVASPDGQTFLDSISLEGLTKGTAEYKRRSKAQEELGSHAMDQLESQPEMYNRLTRQYGTSMKGVEAAVVAQAAQQAKEDALRAQYGKEINDIERKRAEYSLGAIDKKASLMNRVGGTVVGGDGETYTSSGGGKSAKFDLQKSKELADSLISGQGTAWYNLTDENNAPEMRKMLTAAANTGGLTPALLNQVATEFTLTKKKLGKDEINQMGKRLAELVGQSGKGTTTRPLDLSGVDARREMAHRLEAQKLQAQDKLTKLGMGYNERMDMQAREKLAPLFAEYSQRATENAVPLMRTPQVITKKGSNQTVTTESLNANGGALTPEQSVDQLNVDTSAIKKGSDATTAAIAKQIASIGKPETVKEYDQLEALRTQLQKRKLAERLNSSVTRSGLGPMSESNKALWSGLIDGINKGLINTRNLPADILKRYMELNKDARRYFSSNERGRLERKEKNAYAHDVLYNTNPSAPLVK